MQTDIWRIFDVKAHVQATEHEDHFKIKVSVSKPNAEKEKNSTTFYITVSFIKKDIYKW